MKKLLVGILIFILSVGFVFAVQTPVFTSPSASGTSTTTAAQTLTVGSCTAGYYYTIYVGTSSPPNTSVLTADATGTTSVLATTETTYYYQALCGNGYQPTNYTKLNSWFPLDFVDSDYTNIVTSNGTTNSSTDVYSLGLYNLTTANNVSGKVNQGISFNGVNTRINGTYPDLTTSDFTMSVWFKTNPTSSNGYIVTLANASHNSLSLYITSDYRVIGYIDNGTTSFSGGSTTALSTNTWYNAMLVYGSALKRAALYLNGEYIGISGSSNVNVPINQIIIGGEAEATDYKFNGTIDEILIYNTTFTNNEIKALYLLQNNDTGYSSVGNWTYNHLDSVSQAAKVSCGNTKMTIFAGLALVGVALIVLAAFAIVNMFNGNVDTASLSVLGVSIVGIAIVIMIGYYIISTVGASICLA